MIQKTAYPDQYDDIVKVIKSSGGYLVGGAVRDILLSRPVRDLDFAVPGDSINLARKVADRLGGDFYTLDQERKTARVILTDQSNQRFNVDFTLFQGGTIEEDLKSRDFTITSMAIDFVQDNKIIDPFQGAQDLKDGVIRTTTTAAIKNDPIRCLRAIRMAAQFKLRILPEVLEQIHQYQHMLVDISPERIRDELFSILEGPNQTAALVSLNQLGTYQLIFPGKLTGKQQHIIRWLENFWSLLHNTHNQDSAANWSLGLFVHRLGRFRENIQDHLNQELVAGRSIYQLSFLVPLISSAGEKGTEKFNPALIALSNQENDRLMKSYHAVEEFRLLSSSGEELPPLSVYRYFRSYGAAGVESIFLGLADKLDEVGSSKDDRWLDSLDSARSLLEGWWDKYDQIVDPPALLNGHDLQQELSLKPGPRMGQLLEELREAQVSGDLNTRQQALDFTRLAISREDGS